jgi:hypothetical protein
MLESKTLRLSSKWQNSDAHDKDTLRNITANRKGQSPVT